MKRLYTIAILITVAFLAFSFRGGEVATPYLFPKMGFFPPMPASENNPVTVQGADLGRFLFYDPILSIDSSISCGSCHRQEAAFSDGSVQFSKGHNGSVLARNTPPLYNLAWYPAMFWDGKAVSIEEQVFHPVRAHDEMNLQWAIATERIKASSFYTAKFRQAFGNVAIDSMLIAKAIAQFERTLLSYRSRYDSVLAGETVFTRQEYEGFELMNDMTKGDCLHCHTTDADALGTTLAYSNNGLDAVQQYDKYKDLGRGAITGDINDYGKFKIPSLRNIALTAPYMHDGRFKTLEEVLDFYSEGVHNSINVDSKLGSAAHGGVHLTQEEKQKIIAFLHTLTDNEFINDPAFSNPFLSHTKSP